MIRWRALRLPRASCRHDQYRFKASVCSQSGRVEASDGSLFQVIVGLEIHASLQVPNKLFSSAPLSPSLYDAPNTNIRSFDVGLPGSLPFLQLPSVQTAVCAAAALDCEEINEYSRFERKHYVYADLPHGFQITQQRWPLARAGKVQLSDHDSFKTKQKKQQQHSTMNKKPQYVRIRRIQLEQDTGKTTTDGTSYIRVDMNRAGAPLIEIVTEPDMYSSADAVQIVQTIRQRLQFCRVCDGRMDLGHFRIDGNVNIVPLNDDGDDDTTRKSSALTELKNLNSLAQLQAAIDYEARRHAEILIDDSALPMRPETRTWVDNHSEFMRYKDDENDYRFMPEPDLPPLALSKALGMSVKDYLNANLPELPEAAVERMNRKYSIPIDKAEQISNDPAAVEYLDQAMKVTQHGIVIANWMNNELAGLLNADNERPIRESPISALQLAELANMLQKQVISSRMAKNLFEILYKSSSTRFATVRELAAHHNLVLITDSQALRTLCETVIAEHPEEMDAYRKGGKFKAKITKLFTGKAMSKSKGNAHPERLQEVLKETLEES